MVLLQARDPVEAIRLRANRLWVMRRGQIVAQRPRHRHAVAAGSTRAWIGPCGPATLVRNQNQSGQPSMKLVGLAHQSIRPARCVS